LQTFLQPGKRHRRSAWLRLTALLGVLLVSLMSTVQASHHHPTTPSHQRSSRNGPQHGDQCPLCMALHSALPVSTHAPEPVLRFQVLDIAAATTGRAFQWRFEMASRPPPVPANCA